MPHPHSILEPKPCRGSITRQRWTTKEMDMTYASLPRRAFLRTLALAGGAVAAGPLLAQEPAGGLKQPVYRVAKKAEQASGIANHPLDPALDFARDALVRSQRDVADYTATIVKRERIAGVLGEYE